MKRNAKRKASVLEDADRRQAKRIKLYVMGASCTQGIRNVFPHEVSDLIGNYVTTASVGCIEPRKQTTKQTRRYKQKPFTWLDQLGARCRQKCVRKADQAMIRLLADLDVGLIGRKGISPVDTWLVHTLPPCAFAWFTTRSCRVQIVRKQENTHVACASNYAVGAFDPVCDCTTFRVHIVVGDSEWTCKAHGHPVLMYRGREQQDSDVDWMIDKQNRQFERLHGSSGLNVDFMNLVDNAPVASASWHMLQRYLAPDKLEFFMCLRSFRAFVSFMEDPFCGSGPWPTRTYNLSRFAWIDVPLL